jgi:Protein of unknown function (DUF3108)
VSVACIWNAAAALAIGLMIAPLASAESFRAVYDASMLGVVNIGQVSFEATAASGAYSSTASLRTVGFATLFDQTDITASAYGSYGERGVAWVGYNLSHAYARKFRRIQMRRLGARVVATITPRFGNMGDPPATPEEQVGAHDPVSALFALARLVGRTQACSASLRVFNGREHYRLSLAGGGVTTYRGGGYVGPAFMCTLRYTPISGFAMTPQERARIPAATVWLARPAPGGLAVPLRLRVPTPLGDAQLALHSYSHSS